MITRRSNRQHMRHLIVQLREKLDSRCHLPPTMYDDVLDNEQWKQSLKEYNTNLSQAIVSLETLMILLDDAG